MGITVTQCFRNLPYLHVGIRKKGLGNGHLLPQLIAVDSHAEFPPKQLLAVIRRAVDLPRQFFSGNDSVRVGIDIVLQRYCLPAVCHRLSALRQPRQNLHQYPLKGSLHSGTVLFSVKDLRDFLKHRL